MLVFWLIPVGKQEYQNTALSICITKDWLGNIYVDMGARKV